MVISETERNRKRMRLKIRTVRRFKAKKGCCRCSERDPDALQLHHRDPATKNPRLRSREAAAIAPTTKRRRYLQNVYNLGWRALQAELGKCDVICANCHAKMDARRRREHHHRLPQDGY